MKFDLLKLTKLIGNIETCLHQWAGTAGHHAGHCSQETSSRKDLWVSQHLHGFGVSQQIPEATVD